MEHPRSGCRGAGIRIRVHPCCVFVIRDWLVDLRRQPSATIVCSMQHAAVGLTRLVIGYPMKKLAPEFAFNIVRLVPALPVSL